MQNMTYEEFLQYFKEKAHKELGYSIDGIKLYSEGFTSEDSIMSEWIADCNQKFSGEESEHLLTDILTMEMPESEGIANLQRIAIRKLYENYLEKGFDAVFDDVRKMHKTIKDTAADKEAIDARSSGEYEKIRDQLILRPLNYKLHAADLKGCVYRKVNDFVLCLYQVMADTKDNLMTSKIKRRELEKWGLSEDVVIQNAMENSARRYPPCVFERVYQG